MPSALGHTVAALAIGSAFPRRQVRAVPLVTGVVLAVLPDADVLGWRLGVPYESLFGHRGLTHSLAFAAFVAGLGTLFLGKAGRPRGEGSAGAAKAGGRRWQLFTFLLLVAASHGLLDAATDG